MRKLFLNLLLAFLAPLWLFIQQASAANVTYSTTGIINCPTGVGITGCGTSTIDINGITRISFVGAPSGTVVMNPPPTANTSSLGDVFLTCVNGSTFCASQTIPANVTLTISVTQTSPGAGSGSLLPGTISGSFGLVSGAANITWPTPHAAVITTPGVASVSYSSCANPKVVTPNFSNAATPVLACLAYTDLSALTLTPNSGTTPQSTQVTTAFPTALSVTLLDSSGAVLPGRNVTFTAPGSGASGVFSNGTNTITVLTNATGIASAPFTANATVGFYAVTATSPGSTTANFFLTNTPGPPSSMTSNPGTTPQSTAVGTAFPVPPSVTVRDAFGPTPVPGVNVTFTAPASGASGLFSNGSNTITVATGPTGPSGPTGGVAAAPFTANTTVGSYNVTATTAGLPPVVFSLTNTVGGPATMTANPGTTPQSTSINTPFPVPLGVTVRDVGNNPVPGINVTFTGSDTSASGVFSNGSLVIVVPTNASGVATAPYTANATVGPHSVDATVGSSGVSPVVFSLNNLPPPPALTSISPPSVTQSTISNFLVTLNGSGFQTYPAACLRAVFQGGANPSYPVTVQSDTVATVTVPANDPLFRGGDYNVVINVLSTGAGCPASPPPPTASQPFTYRLVPTITTLNPVAVFAGSGNSDLVVNGTNFLSRCQVRRVLFDNTVIRTIVSGSAAAPPNLTDTSVLATIPAAQLVNPRATTVTVETGDNSPGGTFVCGTASAPFNVVLSSSITTTALPDAPANVLYNFQLQAQFNCAAGLCAQLASWAATGLPQGLTLNPQTGVISGTPVQPGTSTVNITLTDTIGRISTVALPLRVTGLQITAPDTLPTISVNQPLSLFIVAINGTAPIAWSISAGSLPQGVTLNPNTGLLSGAPVIGGVFPFTVRAVDTPGTTATRDYVLTVIGGQLSIITTSLASGAINQPYSQPVVASGGTPPYTWTASNLPPGLSINPATGIINGTPTQAGTFAATITVRDSGDPNASVSANLQLVISTTIDPLRILTGSLPPGTVGQLYSTQLAGSGGTTPFAWTATGLPSGLTLDRITGILSGTPQTNGDFPVTITLTDPGQRTASVTLPLTINTSAITITTLAIPDLTVGVPASVQLNATGGQTPFTWLVTSGTLPTGLQLATNGLLSGTPTLTGPFTITVSVSGPNSTPAFRTFTFNVNPNTLTITTAALNATVNQFFQQVLTATGGLAPFVWSATGLPAGFSINPDSGLLFGTPATAGTTTISVTLRDALNNTATRSIPLTVTGDPLRIITETLLAATANTFFSQQVIAAGGIPPYVFTGSLPAGFSISSSGVINGIPAITGAFSISVNVVDATGQSVSRSYSLTVIPPIAPPLSIGNPNLPPGTVGVPYTQTIPVQGGIQPYRFGVNSGSIPGLTLSTGGVLSGTPTQAGTFPLTIVVTDNNGATVVLTVFVVINASPLTITAPAIPPTVLGNPVSVQLQVNGGVSPLVFNTTSPLPAGLTLSATGLISGTPTISGNFTVGVRVTDNAGQTSQTSITIVVLSPIQSGANQLPGATVGDAYTFGLNVTGGLPPFTFRLLSGPDGFSLSVNGTLSGTPTQAGSFPVTVQVTDTGGQQVTLNLNLNVLPGLRFTGSTIPSAIAGAQFSFNLPVAGGEAPFTFSATGLPAGLSITSDGTITGTPTQIGTFDLVVTVSDGQGRNVSQTFAFTVQAAPLRFTSPSQLPDGTAGSPYSQSLAAVGGQPPFTFSVASGALPAGLSLNPTTGAITGTPLAGGTFNFTIQLQDSSGTTASTGVTLRVALPALGRATITGVGPTVPPLTQPTPALALPAAYPIPVTGTLTLTFIPAAGTLDDPSILFSNGLRTVNFTIPANQTTAQFPTGFGLSVGTNAGIIRLTASFAAGGTDITPSPAPTQDITVLAAVPVISSVDVTRSGNAFSVVIVGFSTTREVSSARFSFTPVAGQPVQTTDFTVAVTQAFTTWYQSADSRPFGSQFKLTIPFTIQGNASAVNALSVTLTNSVGASQAATKTF